MSEEILKALMQLFAIIAKQDDGVQENEVAYVKKFLQEQISDEAVDEYMERFREQADIDEKSKARDKESKANKRTSVKDSVRILGICKKINKRLNQGQKVVVLLRLFELINADRKFSDQRMAIINTVADVFNISQDEFKSIESFVIETEPENLDQPNILTINSTDEICTNCKHIKEPIDGSIFILRVLSVQLYFLKYTGEQDIVLNGLIVNNKRIYLFANGSSIKLPLGKPVYYSDVVARFMEDTTSIRISFNVKNLSYQFGDGTYGVRNVNISEKHGKLAGIMGASGAGKTTLLNVISGVEKPTHGEVDVNGYNLHTETDHLKGVFGYIPQDDLLIEELTVFQNLYFSAKQSFDDKSEDEIETLVNKTLQSLGLYEIKNLRVGTPLNKLISGGQRKRLNIALELIREPSILFVDEPTSGLSSRDSENVMDLLSELALKGKLVFVVIHQPQSEIYKMFDSMVILDMGGYMVYYGNPIEALSFFKRMDAQINSEVGQCPTCGNVTPELIFNILEAHVVDEFGQYTNTRKTSPKRWEELYREHHTIEFNEDITETPPSNLNIPNWFKQINIYTIRDFLKKISNTQYLLLTLLEAPILGFILSYIIRYIDDPSSQTYFFRYNENIPPYIFMSIIVALFLGMIVSAEEIFRDKKILQRERFLNLSRSSYLLSKIGILFLISAIQSLLFIIIGNSILEIRGMYFDYWYVMFVTAALANLLGLNISAGFNSAVTIYILIPLLMIPQMALGGAMFSFDKLNKDLGKLGKVPIVAEIMPSRWAYEALMVSQFKNNKFEKRFYELDKKIENSNFKTVHHIPELRNYVNNTLTIADTLDSRNKEVEKFSNNLKLIKNEIKKLQFKTGIEYNNIEKINKKDFNEALVKNIRTYLSKLASYYRNQYQKYNTKKQKIVGYLSRKNPEKFQRLKQNYHNQRVTDIVRKVMETNKIARVENHLVQRKELIFLDPDSRKDFTFRTHFMAPRKHFLGSYFSTLHFNMWVVWFMTILLYIALYYDLLRKGIEASGKINIGKIPVDKIKSYVPYNKLLKGKGTQNKKKK